MQGNNLINIISFGLRSPEHFGILLAKARERFFGRRGGLSASQNLDWIKKNCTDYQQLFALIDGALWQESLLYSAELKKHADAILTKTGQHIGGGGIYPILYFLTRLKKPACIVETGVAAGFSSQAFLKAIEKNGQGMLYSSDLPYFRLKNPEQYIGIIVEEPLKKYWKLFIKGDKANIAQIKRMIDGSIDLFHYDSDKSYSGREFALRQLEGLFSRDAVIIFDDIQDNSQFYDYVARKNIGKEKYHIFEFEGKYVGVVANIKQ